VTEIISVVSAVLAGLLSLIVALLSVIYRNDQKAYETSRVEMLARIAALEKRDTEHETRLAVLSTNNEHSSENSTRLNATLDKLDGKLDEFGRELAGLRTELVSLGRRLSGGSAFSGGQMPAVKPR
jgi:chromosome segregation ATPase